MTQFVHLSVANIKLWYAVRVRVGVSVRVMARKWRFARCHIVPIVLMRNFSLLLTSVTSYLHFVSYKQGKQKQ